MKFIFNFVLVGLLRFLIPHQCSTSSIPTTPKTRNWVTNLCRGGQDYRYEQQHHQQQQQYNRRPPSGEQRPPPQEFERNDINTVSTAALEQQRQQQQQQQQRTTESPSYNNESPPPQLPGEELLQQQSEPPSPPQLPNEELPPNLPDANGGDGIVDPWLNTEEPHPPQQQQEQQKQPTHHDDSGLDLSQLDKDYILRGLAKLYRKKMLPLELSSRYGHFHSSPLTPSDFEAPPMVLLLGQYSVGKTSFIKYLLGRDFPGIRVGPEPTTDRFTAVLYGPSDKIVPGAALCSQMDKPFRGLSPFGNNFLSRMEGVEIDSPILRDITLVDTPGILSGHKQRSRNYDYDAVMKWFAERADLIIVMFDAHKLDISDELHSVMNLMIPHLDKLRIVLNKADSVSTQQLMRVYGALMWSLGKVMNTPEVCRVYMGSFWDKPLQNTEQATLLRSEERDLLTDIMKLPNQAIMRKINDLVRRSRSVKVHAYMIHYLRKQLKYTWSKKEKQKKLVGRLESEMLAAARRYGLAKGDFPPIQPFRQALCEIKDLSEFPKLDKKMVQEMDKVFSQDIPKLLEHAQH